MKRGGQVFRTFTAVAILCSGIVALAQAASPKQGDAPKHVLVELFTSEGCSSCPPADQLLARVNGARTDRGQVIVGISEHVTYWNSDGWTDPYSSEIYTNRQKDYVDRFGLQGPYTPQMVINGDEQIEGADVAGLARALQKEQQEPYPVAVRIQSAAVDGKSLNVSYSAIGDGSVHKADIVAVITDDHDQSSVARGENAGKELAHVAVARSFSRIGNLPSKTDSKADSKADERQVRISLPNSFQAGQGHHLIVFAQTPGERQVLGVDTKAF